MSRLKCVPVCFVFARLSLISPRVMLIAAPSLVSRRGTVLNYCPTYFSQVAENAGAPSHLIGSAVVARILSTQVRECFIGL